jgi:F0F1-type ATP synthase assembly protein I
MARLGAIDLQTTKDPSLVDTLGIVPLRMPTKSDGSLTWLGKYLSLAFTLPASVVAGYLLAAFLEHWLHWPILRAIGILLGMAAGLVQIIRELSRDEQRSGERR